MLNYKKILANEVVEDNILEKYRKNFNDKVNILNEKLENIYEQVNKNNFNDLDTTEEKLLDGACSYLKSYIERNLKNAKYYFELLKSNFCTKLEIICNECGKKTTVFH